MFDVRGKENNTTSYQYKTFAHKSVSLLVTIITVVGVYLNKHVIC